MHGLFVTDDLHSYAYTTYYQVSFLFLSREHSISVVHPERSRFSGEAKSLH